MCGWYETYRNITEGRVLLVVNGGAHYHTFRGFREMLDDFADNFHPRNSNDLIWFRTTGPGHKDCFNNTLGRFPANYSEFERFFGTSKFGWDQFQYFNAYAETRLHDTSVRILRVHNMTALGVDGHKSATDCLHYELPGVVDWWNHLLYTNLLDLALRRRDANVTSIRAL
jgi:hypothetical protein